MYQVLQQRQREERPVCPGSPEGALFNGSLMDAHAFVLRDFHRLTAMLFYRLAAICIYEIVFSLFYFFLNVFK